MYPWNEEEKRVPIPPSVKKEVYERAGGICENPKCLLPKNHIMKKNEGHFHHIRKPSITPTAKTVQFLCPNCHQWHAHERKTKTESGLFGDTKTVVLKRKRVGEKKDTKKPTTTTSQYICKLSAGEREWQCDKKNASSSCLKASYFGERCPNLRVSRRK